MNCLHQDVIWPTCSTKYLSYFFHDDNTKMYSPFDAQLLGALLSPIGTLRRLAKHPKWSMMNRVTLSQVSNSELSVTPSPLTDYLGCLASHWNVTVLSPTTPSFNCPNKTSSAGRYAILEGGKLRLCLLHNSRIVVWFENWEFDHR